MNNTQSYLVLYKKKNLFFALIFFGLLIGAAYLFSTILHDPESWPEGIELALLFGIWGGIFCILLIGTVINLIKFFPPAWKNADINKRMTAINKGLKIEVLQTIADNDPDQNISNLAKQKIKEIENKEAYAFLNNEAKYRQSDGFFQHKMIERINDDEELMIKVLGYTTELMVKKLIVGKINNEKALSEIILNVNRHEFDICSQALKKIDTIGQLAELAVNLDGHRHIQKMAIEQLKKKPTRDIDTLIRSNCPDKLLPKLIRVLPDENIEAILLDSSVSEPARHAAFNHINKTLTFIRNLMKSDDKWLVAKAESYFKNNISNLLSKLSEKELESILFNSKTNERERTVAFNQYAEDYYPPILLTEHHDSWIAEKARAYMEELYPPEKREEVMDNFNLETDEQMHDFLLQKLSQQATLYNIRGIIDTLNYGLDINTKSKWGNKDTVLHDIVSKLEKSYSDIKKKIPVIKKLLQFGADPNARNDRGMTPIQYVHNEKATPEVIDCLLDGGADINAVDDYGRNVINHAISIPENASLVGYLISLGAAKDIKDRDQTPLEKVKEWNKKDPEWKPMKQILSGVSS